MKQHFKNDAEWLRAVKRARLGNSIILFLIFSLIAIIAYIKFYK